eukprot:Skav232460  [mRNA]  locus=scaffold75:85663:93909:+ [translate_table: standard]
MLAFNCLSVSLWAAPKADCAAASAATAGRVSSTALCTVAASSETAAIFCESCASTASNACTFSLTCCSSPLKNFNSLFSTSCTSCSSRFTASWKFVNSSDAGFASSFGISLLSF